MENCATGGKVQEKELKSGMLICYVVIKIRTLICGSIEYTLQRHAAKNRT